MCCAPFAGGLTLQLFALSVLADAFAAIAQRHRALVRRVCAMTAGDKSLEKPAIACGFRPSEKFHKLFLRFFQPVDKTRAQVCRVTDKIWFVSFLIPFKK
jgi:hypothetical protein